MTDTSPIGQCDQCKSLFNYAIIHNGFGDTAYAYCTSCGIVTILSGWFDQIPKNAKLRIHQNITSDIEPFLKLCSCGGQFKSGASPRCPHCHAELSAEAATEWIERNAPGTAKGWRWQKNWVDTYAIIIEKKFLKDNWKEENR